MSDHGADTDGIGISRTRFFEPGGTLSYNSPCYVSRQADDALVGALRAHDYCYLLDSRQKGKSSLMVRTATLLKGEGIQTVVVDLQGRGSNLKLEQWYAGMLTRFGDELGIRSELLKYWETNQRLGPLDRFFGAIDEVVLPKIDSSLVVFVDEVDFVRSLPFPTDEFFGGIRHFYNRRATDRRFEKLSFVLIGTADPVELIADPNLTPFNIGRRIELQDFKLEECGPLAKGLNENPLIAASLMERIIYWTSGHPYLTQRLCEKVLEGEATKASGVDKIVSQIFLSAEAQTSEPNLHDVGRRVAEGVPVGTEPSDYFRRAREIYARLLRGKAVVNNQQDPVIASMKLSGLVAAKDGNLVIRTRIYKQVFDLTWVEQLGAGVEDDGQAHTGFLSPKVRARRTRLTRLTLISFAAVLAVLVCIYRLMLSLGQPSFQLDADGIYPGETLFLNGSHLAGSEAMIYDDIGHELIIPVQSNDDAASPGYGYSIPIAKTVPPGRYILKISRTPFLGFLSFGWSPNYKNVTIGDNRPFDLIGHQGIVATASFSPDGRHVLTADSDKTARIWDLSNGLNFRELKGHKDFVLSAYYSQDGNRIVTASWDKTAIIWDAATCKPLVHLIGHQDQLWRASFSPDGSKVVTASSDRTARIWDAKTGKELLQLKGNQGRVMCDNFSPDGTKIATASFDGTVRLWDAMSGKQLLQISKPRTRFFFVSFSPDGSRIVTASDDNLAVVWNAANGKKLLVLKGHQNWVVFAAYSPDGTRISTSSADKTARIWDATTGKMLFQLIGHKVRVNTAYFSPDGTRIVTAALAEKLARIWDAKTGIPLRRPVQ